MNENKLTEYEVIKKLRENRDNLKKFGVKRVGLFGSFVRGNQRKESDIDLVVEFDLSLFGKDFEGLFDAFMDLSTYLEDLFKKKVDILTPESIDTIRVKEVAEEIKRSLVYV
ncbi:MAG: nucleotidyltransferase domain-containing protein [Actinobacteria bacterium]|nr:nucleotidyltransferase domain-containing protein [Actinomycetota bacterium]MCL5985960.1 nucleotidyltransferase domain-containing protein [Actinomycetota bacterium]